MRVIGRWESRERSSWWVFVLWSVTARKSSPRSMALATSSSTVLSPSEWMVWQWRSPFSQRGRPGGGPRLPAGGGGAPRGGGGGGGAGGPRHGEVEVGLAADVVRRDVPLQPQLLFHAPS